MVLPALNKLAKVTANLIEGHLSVVVLTGLLGRIRQLDAQGLKCLFLLGLGMTITIIRIFHRFLQELPPDFL